MERRLGRGLGSLLGSGPSSNEPAEVQVEEAAAATEVLLDKIRPNPFQPRKEFDPVGIEELASSITQHGLLQPIVLRRTSENAYELIAGERRVRAARKVGLASLPAVIRESISDQDMLELALVENVQRRGLNPIEKALGFREMQSALRLNQEQVADKVGLKRSTVANHLRLLSLPVQAQDALVEGLITMGHARALVGLHDKQVLEFVARIARDGLSVRQTETQVRAAQAPGGDPAEEAADPPDKEIVPRAPWISDIESRMRENLGTKVQIKNNAGYRGQIVIDYFNRGDLDRLIEKLAPSQGL